MARKIPSEFVPLDVKYTRDPSIRAVGIAGEVLFIRSLAHVRLHETDGFIADFDLSVLAFGIRRARDVAAALVSEGLWITAEGGWRVRSWEKWNGTKAEVNAEREAQKKAAQATTHKVHHIGKGDLKPWCPLCQAVASDVASELGTESQKEKEKETKKETKKEKEREKESVGSDVDRPTADRSAGGADAPTQTLIAEWIDHCDTRPPSRVVGQVAKEIKALLDEGQPYADVRTGLAAWARKGLHPSTLASVVHETRSAPARRGTTDQRVAEGLDLAARLRAEETATTIPQIGA